MKVDDKIFTAWKAQYKHGDGARIAAKAKVSVETIRPALRTGEMTLSTFNIINNYYKPPENGQQ